MDDTAAATLHFDLRHIKQKAEFTLRAGGNRRYRLIPYAETPAKLQQHRATNKALALVDDAHAKYLTHYVENAELPARGVSLRSVVFPSLDDHPLPETALEFIHIGAKDYAMSVKLNPWASGRVQFPLILKDLGVSPEAIDDAEMDELRLHAALIMNPKETAKAIIFHHPNLATKDKATAAKIFDNHVKDSQDFVNLYQYIIRNGPGSPSAWYQKTWSTWINPDTKKEEPVPARTDLKDKDGKPITFPKNPNTGEPGIPQQVLSGDPGDAKAGVLGVAAPVLQQVLRETQNDQTLNGQLWTKQTGTTRIAQSDVPPTGTAAPGAAAAAKGWTLKNKTSSFGLNLFADELSFSGKSLSFPVKNWPNRYLGAYVEFFKPDGTAIDRGNIAGWPDSMPSVLRAVFEPSSTKNYLTYISAGNSIFGIPVDDLTNKTDLSFPWPEEASKASVLIGGLGFAEGFTDWDSDVDVGGALATGLISYGVSILSLAFTVKIKNPFLAKQSQQTLYAIYEVGLLIGLVAGFIAALNFKSSSGKYVLAFLADKFVSLVVGALPNAALAAKKLLEKESEEIMASVVAEEAEEAIPVAGRILQVASVLADIASLTATTVEVGGSPATYKLEVTRTLDLTVTVKPDPKHAKPGAKPIWPLVADHYIISVSYPGSKGQEGGTSYVKDGPMPGQHDADITVTFEGIPAGGKCEVVAGVYSASNWLAGRWSSGWIDAVPTSEDKLAVSGSITENLVPLTPTTTYSQKQRLIYDNAEKKYLWDVTQFSIGSDLAKALDAKDPGPLRAPFAANGNELPSSDSDIVITVQAAGNRWQLEDKSSSTLYQIQRKDFYGPDGKSFAVLEVQDKTHEIPPIPDVVNDCASDGNRICERVNITVNNAQYQLGYTWKASGMNLPVDNGNTPENGQIYVFQSISTLGQPGDWIIEPTRGFTQQPYLAFDQFGLQPLFTLDFATYEAELNKGGAVSPQLAAAFAGNNLPADAQITIVTADVEWRIGATGQDPLFELRSKTTATGENEVTVIDVFAYPVPALDNFWVDPRPGTIAKAPDLKVYHLRGVTFQKGTSTFDYASDKSWGAFIVPNLNAVAIHPHGYVIGVEWGHFGADTPKMHVLKLPAEALNEADAPLAAPLSGFGQREGLMSQPVALTITADGRILVLEQGNRRIQAFDIRANPVQVFAGPVHFTLDAGFIKELDSKTVSLELKQAFQRSLAPWPFYGTPPDPSKQSPMMLAPLVTGEASWAADLDQGRVNADLIKAFQDRGYTLPEDPSQIEVTVTTKGGTWMMTDTVNKATFDLRLVTPPKEDQQLMAFQAPALSVAVTAPGQAWKITDSVNAMTFDIEKPASSGAAGDLSVRQLVSTMALRDEGTAKIDYLDLAVEAKGYIYVLSRTTDGGGKPVYRLDIYNPDGSVLLDKPQTGINAAKLTVDQWRTLFTLNLDKFLGAGTRTEPGISTWIPSTPGSPGGG